MSQDVLSPPRFPTLEALSRHIEKTASRRSVEALRGISDGVRSIAGETHRNLIHLLAQKADRTLSRERPADLQYAIANLLEDALEKLEKHISADDAYRLLGRIIRTDIDAVREVTGQYVDVPKTGRVGEMYERRYMARQFGRSFEPAR